MKTFIATYYPNTLEIFEIHEDVKSARDSIKFIKAINRECNLQIAKFECTDEEYQELTTKGESKWQSI